MRCVLKNEYFFKKERRVNLFQKIRPKQPFIDFPQQKYNRKLLGKCM